MIDSNLYLFFRSIIRVYRIPLLTLTMGTLIGFLIGGCTADTSSAVKPVELSDKDKAIIERMKKNPPPPRNAGRNAGGQEK